MIDYKIIYDFLTPNKYSRSRKQIKEMRKLIIHWVANPMTTSLANRNFFENRKHGNTGYGSAHEIIDLDGKSTLICIPSDEVSYNCGGNKYTPIKESFCGSDNPNYYTYGIECTHPDWSGKFSQEVIDVLIDRCVSLCIKFKLNPRTDIIRHYDVTYKDCPKFYVNNPNEWDKLIERIGNAYDLKVKEISMHTVKVQLPNGNTQELEGVFQNDKNYVAIRPLLEALNYKVGWDNELKIVTINK